MKKVVWLQTDLGYQSTKNHLLKLGGLTGDSQDWKGRLTFSLKDFKDVTYQITTRSKLGVFYPEEMDFETAFERIKPLLVKADGSPAETFLETHRNTSARVQSASNAIWKKNALRELSRVGNMIASGRDDDSIGAPEAALQCLRTVLPPKIRREMKLEIARLENLIQSANKVKASNPLQYTILRKNHLAIITEVALRPIIEKAFDLVHKN